ncbi:MAG: VOC family protein, partial [Chroococcidiopsidaceae cyanobacterium CP_BM_RX_35]|nr:VOC family protein [Chroococcidiopsidaceae cyanobacterium CP_BM_RX_35]
CQDPIATEKFYTKYFDFKRSRVVPLGKEQVVYLKLGNMYLELFQAQGQSPIPTIDRDGPQYPAWRHLAFQVDNVDAKLAEMGNDAKITLGPLSFDDFIPGWRSVWLSDPNGNIVEISQGYVDQDHPPTLEADLASRSTQPAHVP